MPRRSPGDGTLPPTYAADWAECADAASEIYTEEGVRVFLSHKNRLLDNRSPEDLIRATATPPAATTPTLTCGCIRAAAARGRNALTGTTPTAPTLVGGWRSAGTS